MSARDGAKRVLLIAYHYPPEGSSSGVLRTLAFSKYLAAYGWSPYVLTLRESAYTVRDEELRRQIPAGVPVHRTPGFDTTRHLAIRGRYLSLLATPDRYVSWLPFGVARGLGIIRREGIQAIFSTLPVPTAHLIAESLHVLTRVPWVADFRDPWIEEGIFPPPGSFRYGIERRLEAGVVRRASRITVTTPGLGAELKARHPGQLDRKIRVIYNGYDEENFADLPMPQRAERFEIVHAGLMTPEFRDPSPILEELARLIAEGKIAREETRVSFIGGGPWAHSEDFAARVRSSGLADLATVEGRIPHREALLRQAHAAALLVLQASDDTRQLIPAKAFEYLRLGRPILALTLDGATADLLRGQEQCHVHGPADRSGIRGALIELHRFWQESPSGSVLARPVHAYERSRLAGQLAGVFDELTVGARP